MISGRGCVGGGSLSQSHSHTVLAPVETLLTVPRRFTFYHCEPSCFCLDSCAGERMERIVGPSRSSWDVRSLWAREEGVEG
ncbi:hypothetical protein E2C01_070570 [Portunus trituberculatus]|uniref:Uncharacterized protein n=1 Tax=Portunus trituberculatus TaxID=210409 RepID=A0A5B7I5S3_PORTR|nr:hypothetical protein [Portunus trituberculatus]